MNKKTSEAIMREFEERFLRRSPPWWRVADEEFIKKWRRSPKRRELLESFRHQTEQCLRGLLELQESGWSESPHVFHLLYESNKLRRTRPHSLSYKEAVAACKDVERRMAEKGEKWSVALEEVAKEYEVSPHTIQRIRRDKRIYGSVERQLRIEAGRLAPIRHSPKN